MIITQEQVIRKAQAELAKVTALVGRRTRNDWLCEDVERELLSARHAMS